MIAWLLALAMGIPADSLPPMGIATRDTTGGWCAAVAGPALEPGRTATVVLVHADAPAVAYPARIVRRRAEPCHSEFPQLSLEELPAYDLAADSSMAEGLPWTALAVVSRAAWRRQPEGRAVADLDGDGLLEEARVCAADEGEHFTLWTIQPGVAPRRRWHGYYDWGALVDPTCGPGESGG